MNKTLTRRGLGIAVLSATAAPVPAQAPAAPGEELERARDAVRRTREVLASYKIDRAVEPAVQFKAY